MWVVTDPAGGKIETEFAERIVVERAFYSENQKGK